LQFKDRLIPLRLPRRLPRLSDIPLP
jgi:hypothetical protein